MPSSDGKRIDALDFTHPFRAFRRFTPREARRKLLSDIAPFTRTYLMQSRIDS
jgi:hypothetical protein